MPDVDLAPEDEEELDDAEEAPVLHLPMFRPKGPPPKTRGDCLPGGLNEARPCGWITCKWFLPRLLPDAKFTCALDVADLGGVTLEEVGDLMGITRERIRQIEEKALRKIKMIDRNVFNRGTLKDLSEVDGSPRGWNW